MYTCDGLNSEDLGPGGNCHEQSGRIGDCRGSSGLLIAAWAVGGIVSVITTFHSQALAINAIFFATKTAPILLIYTKRFYH